ncbi:MAG: putative transcriptional regulator [Pirellulaceae bacterium]|jgi:predicted transcriptional regulator
MIVVKSARDFMVVDLVKLSPNSHVFDGISQLVNCSISGAPVVDKDGNYLGLFSEKCCMHVLRETARLAEFERTAAKQFMARELVTLSPKADVFDAIDDLISRRVSGAPVVDSQGNFLGVFSEKTAMQVLIAAAYDRLPGTTVDSYMNTERERLIDEDVELMEVVRIFEETPYRRLPVVKKDRLLGQVSRRDVLRTQHHLSGYLHNQPESQGIRDSQVSDEVREQLPAGRIEAFMDIDAKTITPEDDIFSIAQVFWNTPYRRLPVLQSGKLVGQVSRRDLLIAADELLSGLGS